MQNSLLVGLSRQMALSRELDAVANNIANVNTTGFKADGTIFQEYLQSSARNNDFALPDRRISFVTDRATWHDFSQGAIQQTGNPLDVSVDGNAFFAVQTAAGERYTRNGAFQVNANGELVTADGSRVLGESGPIQFQQTDNHISIEPDGTIRVREGTDTTVDAIRGKLRLVSFGNEQALLKEGANRFRAPAGVQPQPAPLARVTQGTIEKSNVRPVVEMSRMIEITRAFTQVTNMLQQESDLRKTAIEKLAEAPA